MGKFKERIQSIISPLTAANLHPSAYLFAVLGIMSISAVLNFLFLGEKSLCFDESVSIAIANADWPSVWQTVSRYEVNMGFYYLLLHLWANLGESEFFIRSLSAIFSILTVPVIYALGSRLFSKRVGLLAALLIVVNSFFIQYAQIARGYSLMLFLTALSSLLFIQGLKRPSKWLWAGYIITSVLAIYTHVFAAFVPVMHGLSLVFLRWKEIKVNTWRGLILSAIAIFLLVLPLLVYYFTAKPTNLDFAQRPGLVSIYSVFYNITGGSPVTLVAYFISCVVALFYAVKNWLNVKISYETWRYGLLLVWLLVPVVVAFCISQIKPVFFARYFTICLPPLVLLAAIGIMRLRRLLFLLLIIVLLGVSVYESYQWLTSEEREDWRGVTAYVLDTSEENDVVVFYIPTSSPAFGYYQDKYVPSGEIPIEELYYNPEEYDTNSVLNIPEGFGMGGRLPPPDPNLPERLSKYNNKWLILSHDVFVELGRKAQSQELQELLENQYGIPEEKSFPGILILRYD